jgi:hypothetical protein
VDEHRQAFAERAIADLIVILQKEQKRSEQIGTRRAS